MKKRVLRVFGSGLLAAGLAASAYQLTTVEGVAGLALRLVYGENTQFAAGYSESAFRRVRAGQSEADVLQLLGEPLSRTTEKDGRTYLKYSRSPTDTHYRNRLVVLKGNSVIETFSEFYVD